MMNRITKHIIVSFLLGIFVFMMSVPIMAQVMPKKVTLVFPWGRGDSYRTAEVFLPLFAKHLGIPVELTRIVGMNGQAAIDFVHQSKPNGGTLMFASTTDLLYRIIENPDRPVRWNEMEFVDLILMQPLGCILSPKSRAKNIHELVNAIKNREYTVTVMGYTRLTALFPSFMLRHYGLSLRDVKFQVLGRSAPIEQIMREEPNRILCLSLNSLKQQFNSDEFIPLITNSVRPVKEMPRLLLARDQGVKTLESFHYWNALLAPKGLPKPIWEKFRTALVQVSQDPDWTKFLNEVYGVSAMNKVPDLQKFVREESLFFEKIAILSRWLDE